MDPYHAIALYAFVIIVIIILLYYALEMTLVSSLVLALLIGLVILFISFNYFEVQYVNKGEFAVWSGIILLSLIIIALYVIYKAVSDHRLCVEI